MWEDKRDPFGERVEFPIQGRFPSRKRHRKLDNSDFSVERENKRVNVVISFCLFTPFTVQSCSPWGRKDQERLEAVA